MARGKTITALVQSPNGGGPPVVSHDQPMPQIREPYEVLIRVSVVALNPTDYKMPDYHPVPNAVMGCDFMGTIVAAGPEVDSTCIGMRVCGPMHGSNPGNPNSGAFAEYLIQDRRLLVRVPDSWSDLEGAALGGVGWATVALAMEDSLQLTGTPSKPAPPRPNGTRVPVLVYGGATATGTMACQLLSSAGYDPIATCSPASSALVRKYGAVSTFPYSSPTCGETIRDATKGSIRVAIDCITTPESVKCCFTALGRAGARYASLEHAPDEWRTRKAVKMDMPMTYVVMGREVKLDGVYHRDADQSKFDLGARWALEVQTLVDEGRLKCHPAREVPVATGVNEPKSSIGLPETLEESTAEVPTTESSAAYSWINQGDAWRRKLGSMESFYLSLASPEGQPVHWMIGCSVTIKNHADAVDTEEALREAWKSIRRDFPCVGAVVDPPSREIVVREDADTEEWLQKSFRVHDGTTADELFSAFRSQFHITLHYLRDTNQLLLQSPHTLIDGRGMLYLYHALFTALSTQPGDGSQDYETTGSPNLSKPYDEWLGVSAVPSQKNLADAQSIFQRVLQQERPIRLPGVNFATTPQRPVHRDLEMTEEATSSIIGACKEKGVSVTSAWHAALALATQSAAGEEGTSYVQFTTIDLRRHFPSSFIPHKHSIGSLQTALPFTADLGKDSTFDALSQSLHKQYKTPFAFADNDFSYLAPYMAMSRQILESGGVPPSSTPSLSSMGVVDDYLQRRYGDWEISKFWVSSTMMTGDFQMYLWTFGGKMTFSVCYNEAFYGAEQADQIMASTRDEMVRGLTHVQPFFDKLIAFISPYIYLRWLPVAANKRFVHENSEAWRM
ncbi:hypothetical protein DL770_005894 [Monosporascus sp. CRB-9-2]|nr:hypothetical protein DL770_005894 [Monosporascus sp. CRB-9-2]